MKYDLILNSLIYYFFVLFSYYFSLFLFVFLACIKNPSQSPDVLDFLTFFLLYFPFIIFCFSFVIIYSKSLYITPHNPIDLCISYLKLSIYLNISLQKIFISFCLSAAFISYFNFLDLLSVFTFKWTKIQCETTK